MQLKEAEAAKVEAEEARNLLIATGISEASKVASVPIAGGICYDDALRVANILQPAINASFDFQQTLNDRNWHGARQSGVHGLAMGLLAAVNKAVLGRAADTSASLVSAASASGPPRFVEMDTDTGGVSPYSWIPVARARGCCN